VSVTLLDGPVGTELARRGVALDRPGWSARAIDDAPDVLRSIHADYAGADATVHTAATFRTRPADVGARWDELAAKAVAIARSAVPPHHAVAGSLAPLADCYRPDLSPPDPGPAHRELAARLADLGVDLLLVETFAHPREAVAAVRAAVTTGAPTWCALTPGFRGDLLDPRAMAEAARACVEEGASAILVNCAPAVGAIHWVEALAGLGVPRGVYANAGPIDDGVGWRAERDEPGRYLDLAREWVAAGATLVGGCCGTRPAHVRALRLGLRTPAGTGAGRHGGDDGGARL
jgi:S-methylmethionine-dependent homocysteine/selenocysteine methylase